MNYKAYQNTRDAAWRILLDCKITDLPIDLNHVCRCLGVKAVSYQAHWRDGVLPPLAGLTDGIAFFSGGEPIVLYDRNKPSGRIRFTVAHELGHLVLGHIDTGTVSVAKRQAQPTNSPLERAANQFAARLLAPACVLWGLEVHSVEEIAQLCHISHAAAQIRAQRMQVLYKRQKFLFSPIEQQVYMQFKPFIEEYQRENPARNPPYQSP